MLQDDVYILHLLLDQERLPQRHAEFSLLEHTTFSPEVLVVNQAFGRDFSEERLRARFRNGLRFYDLREQGRPVASTWLVVGPERFLDEAGVFLTLGEGGVSFRDTFVAAHARGRGLFAALSDSVLALHPGARAVFAVVERSNRSSLRAHEKCGFTIAGQYRILHLAGTVMLRWEWPAGLFASGFKVRRRLVVTGPAFRRFVAARLA